MNSKPKPTAEGYTPSHPGLLLVDFQPGDFTSGLKSLQSFDEGDVITNLIGLTRSKKAYTTVQCGPGSDDHVELNSDLVFVNHSCDPNCAFDLSSADSRQWVFRALKTINSGTYLTFFYPSTEWKMDQSFDCRCGTPVCLKKIQGAAFLSKETLDRYWVNPWILRLHAELEQEADDQPRSVKTCVCM